MYLCFDSLFQSFHVADDTYFFAAHLMQFLQCVHNCVQIVTAQRTETFVDEQGIDRQALPAKGREAQGKRKGNHKTFSTGQGTGGTGGTALIKVA